MTAPHLIDALAELDDAADLAAEPLEPLDDPEPPARRQIGHIFELFLEGEAPYTVRVTNRDRIAYEKAAARHKEWPPAEIGQHFAVTFLCWNAARRAGATALRFEQFCDVLEDYELLRDEPADPTR